MSENRILCKYISFFVALAIVLSVAFAATPLLLAAETQIGYVNGVNVYVRTGAGKGNPYITTLTKVQVEVLGSAYDSNGEEWKHIRYGTTEGYMYAGYIIILPSSDGSQTEEDFEQQIAAFPEDYKQALRELHSIYKNWTFEADYLPVTFDEALQAESVFPKKLVPLSYSVSLRSMGKNAYNWDTGTWYQDAGSWVGASKELIAYFMDPRNFLNTTDIYMFTALTYDRTSQTRAGVEKIVEGTFLANGFDDKSDYNGSYIDIIMAAAEQTGISPYMLASTIKQEQGVNGTSPLISGTCEGYVGYYNFLNFGANGATDAQVIANGLQYAVKNGWNSRSKAIIGGAQKLAGNYFSNGQNTYYYKNFDVRSGEFDFQYAQNIYDSKSSSASLRTLYIGDAESELHFIIPVYKNMWTTAPAKPEESPKKNNYYFTSLGVSGFSMYTQSYSVTVSGNTNLSYSVPSGASYAGAGSFALNKGSNTVVLPVKAETGAINNYVLNITATTACTLTIGASGGDIASAVVLGDTNGDGKVSIVDLANVQKHLLKIITLSGNNLTGADTNRDGKITIVDLANVQKHLLKIITLK